MVSTQDFRSMSSLCIAEQTRSYYSMFMSKRFVGPACGIALCISVAAIGCAGDEPNTSNHSPAAGAAGIAGAAGGPQASAGAQTSGAGFAGSNGSGGLGGAAGA